MNKNSVTRTVSQIIVEALYTRAQAATNRNRSPSAINPRSARPGSQISRFMTTP
jgi:hypothetical protein